MFKSTIPKMTCMLATASVLLAPAASNAATISNTGRTPGVLFGPHPGTYIEFANATTASGSGFSNRSDAFGNYVDFFDGTNSLTWQNVLVQLDANQILGIMSRAENQPQQVTVEFFAPGTAGTGPALGTYTAHRYRQTGWAGAPVPVSQVEGFDLPAGAYDIRITAIPGNSDNFTSTTLGGSHFYGIGGYTAPTIITAAGQQVYHESNTTDIDGPAVNAWITRSAINTNNAQNARNGDYSDPQGGAFFGHHDIEVFNPFSEETFVTLTAHARSGSTNNPTGTFSIVEDDGDLIQIGNSFLVGGSWTSLFTEYTSDVFVLPQGFTTLRFNASDSIHYDYLRLDVIEIAQAPVAATVPEPASLGLLALGALAVLGRRRI